MGNPLHVRPADRPLRLGWAGGAAGLIALGAALAGCHEVREQAVIREGSWHRIARGETLLLVAQRYHVSLASLVEANAIADANRVEEGMELFVPPSGAPLRRHAPPARHTRRIIGAVGAVRAVRAVRAAPAAGDGDGPLAWPVHALVTSPFGVRDGRPHEGIDLSVPDGTEVRSAASGEVVYAGEKVRGYGRLVIVRHDPHLVTVYAHNSTLLVSEGQRVARGELLCLSGHTGHVTAPHVHFEVREDNVPRDPQRYLDAR